MGTKRKAKERKRCSARHVTRAAEALHHWQRGIDFAEEGNTLRAIEEMELAATLNPRLPDLYRDLAIVYDRVGAFGKAIACYEKVLALRPDHLDAANDLACIFAAQGRYDDARELLESLLAKYPDHQTVRANLRRLGEMQASRPSPAPCERKNGQHQAISLCMIVKNEEKNLPGCLESVKGLVDEIVVVDTGSTDRTVDVAQSYGARVYHFAWTGDFAAARNESLRHATGDWILYLDADERLEPESCAEIRRLVQEGECGAYTLNILSCSRDGDNGPQFVHPYPRLFRSHAGAKFEMGVHEQIYPSLARAGIELGYASARIIHLGYALTPEEMRRKSERNLQILERQKEKTPHSAFVRHYLGTTYLSVGRYDEGLAELRASLALPSPGFHIKAYTHVCIAEALLRHKSDPIGAIFEAQKALAFDNTLIGPRVVLAHAHCVRGEFASAIEHLEEAIRIEKDEKGKHLKIDSVAPPGYLSATLGSCQVRAGRLEEALASYRQAAAAGYAAHDFLREWGSAALRLGWHEEARQAFNRAAKSAPNAKDKALYLLQRSLAEVRLNALDDARETLQAALACDPDLCDENGAVTRQHGEPEAPPSAAAGARDAAATACDGRLRLLRLLCNVCREAGDWPGVGQVLTELSAAGEHPAVVLAIMAEAMLKLGRPEAAARYAAKALDLAHAELTTV